MILPFNTRFKVSVEMLYYTPAHHYYQNSSFSLVLFVRILPILRPYKVYNIIIPIRNVYLKSKPVHLGPRKNINKL